MAKVKTKICPKCGKRKSLDKFHKSKGRPNGVCVYCKVCTNKYKREKRKVNPEKHRESVRQSRLKHPDTMRAAQIRRSFGVTLEEYDNYYSKTLVEQNGRCAKCGIHCSEKRLVPDHDHSKFGIKAFRGLLCDRCNCGIGLLGDNLEGLMEAVDYIKGHSS